MRDGLIPHLIELRRRLLYCLVALGGGIGISYPFSPILFQVLAQPLEGRQIITTGLPEAFLTYLKLSVVTGSVFALPLILWQVWLFVAPGLQEQEKHMVWPLLLASPVLFILGASLAYYVVCPMAWAFFLSFESPSLRLEARMSEYLSLILQLITAFGLCFQLPLIVLGLFKLGLVRLSTLIAQRKYAFLIIVIVSALLTPPDIISPLLLILPLYGLYELSIAVISILGRKRLTLYKK